MKLLNCVTLVLVIIGLSGCASTYTSINATGEPNKYFVTEVFQGPFTIHGALYECEAEGTSKMVCEKK